MLGFHTLIAWQEAASLAANVILAAPAIRGQSAPSAAGRGLTRDCIRFLRMARSSAMELESHLRVAAQARRLDAEVVGPLIDQTRRVQYLIGRYMASVERRGNL